MLYFALLLFKLSALPGKKKKPKQQNTMVEFTT